MGEGIQHPVVGSPGACLAVDLITSAWSSAELVLESLLRDMALEPWAGRALEPWCGRALESWCGKALEPWGGMAPWFWGHMAPGVEAGMAVSPAAEAGGEGCRVASADENSCFTGDWTYKQNR